MNSRHDRIPNIHNFFVKTELNLNLRENKSYFDVTHWRRLAEFLGRTSGFGSKFQNEKQVMV